MNAMVIKRDVFESCLPHFRKKHIWKNYWLISVFSKSGISGKTELNLRNIVLYPLSFIMVVVKVED